MGSGETSPTMVTVHRSLAAGLPRDASAVLLETPYGFQENVADISARACQYFARSVGLSVAVAPGIRGDPDAGHGNAGNGAAGNGAAGDGDSGLAMLRAADWVFSGPGSPTYALASWRDAPVGQGLHDRLRARRGTTVLASAAAATMGRWTVPVYEIYKVGAVPHWVDGLDLLAHLGLRVAVVPHYDNTEGGTHDTRFCYLGERRLRMMESLLPGDAAVLGVDEHTAVIIDAALDTVRVVGRGGLTVRRQGRSTVLPAGVSTTLAELREIAHGDVVAASVAERVPAEVAAVPAEVTVTEVAAGCERRFDVALARRDAPELAQSILDLEAAIRQWSADTEVDDGVDQARAVLRALIVRLAHQAGHGLVDPCELFGPLVRPLLELREQLRRRREYPTADALRDALAAAGVDLRDGEDGARWSLRPSPRRPL
jgi:hypothetical protein